MKFMSGFALSAAVQISEQTCEFQVNDDLTSANLPYSPYTQGNPS